MGHVGSDSVDSSDSYGVISGLVRVPLWGKALLSASDLRPSRVTRSAFRRVSGFQVVAAVEAV